MKKVHTYQEIQSPQVFDNARRVRFDALRTYLIFLTLDFYSMVLWTERFFAQPSHHDKELNSVATNFYARFIHCDHKYKPIFLSFKVLFQNNFKFTPASNGLNLAKIHSLAKAPSDGAFFSQIHRKHLICQ